MDALVSSWPFAFSVPCCTSLAHCRFWSGFHLGNSLLEPQQEVPFAMTRAPGHQAERVRGFPPHSL